MGIEHFSLGCGPVGEVEHMPGCVSDGNMSKSTEGPEGLSGSDRDPSTYRAGHRANASGGKILWQSGLGGNRGQKAAKIGHKKFEATCISC